MQLHPYLSFKGNAKEALELYAKALNGKINEIHLYNENPEICKSMPEEWHTKVMHGNVVADKITIMVSDVLIAPDSPCGNSPVEYHTSPISLSLNCNSVSELEKVFTILSAGGKITMPLQETFWNARFGMLEDKFGIKWMFNYDYPAIVNS